MDSNMLKYSGLIVLFSCYKSNFVLLNSHCEMTDTHLGDSNSSEFDTRYSVHTKQRAIYSNFLFSLLINFLNFFNFLSLLDFRASCLFYQVLMEVDGGHNQGPMLRREFLMGSYLTVL